eukprot:gnl/MRDRNA2_/MRDRNA2_60813_c0_seq2.p1 gnl/MRDRNA2_/MRDRNA2_60813_c0~~gnl/MRDRNA2_/MRDRNA2_60813_c0_seq2.p1  ORF type:complete len:390 (-),score=84.04 gnl/MRDRNA2_/MRDRNA2_60813_c0_seq2:75-1157(-)
MASLLSYGACQTACNAGVVTCYAAAGLTFGTVTAGLGAPAAALACNSVQATCMAACAAKFLAEGSAETAATGGVMGPVIMGGGVVMSAATAAAAYLTTSGATVASAATTAGAAGGMAAGGATAASGATTVSAAGGVVTVGGMTAARLAVTAFLGIGLGTALAAGAYGAYVLHKHPQHGPEGGSNASGEDDTSEGGGGGEEAQGSGGRGFKQLLAWCLPATHQYWSGGEPNRAINSDNGGGHVRRQGAGYSPEPELQRGVSQPEGRQRQARAAQGELIQHHLALDDHKAEAVPFPLEIRVMAIDFDGREGTVVSIEKGLVGVDFGTGVGKRLMDQERLVVVCNQSGDHPPSPINPEQSPSV